MQTKPIGFECKHAVYVPAQDGSENDLLVVKERQHFEDGSTKPFLRLMKNYERTFSVTLEGHRNHNDKKEWEDKDKLRQFTCTQVGLVKAICRALGRAPVNTSLRMLARSPYLYGTDVTTPVLIKGQYQQKWPKAISPNDVAILDTETDMINGHEEIIMSSLTQQTDERKVRIYQVLTEEYVARLGDRPYEKIKAAFDKYVRPKLDNYGARLDKKTGQMVYLPPFEVSFEFKTVQNAGDVSYEMIQKAHVWKPDILAIWNMNFDIPKMIGALEKYGYNPAKVWSDPKIPAEYQFFKYIQGPAQKVTASGKTMALHPAEQWHTVYTPASFYVLDAMCVYLKIRIAKGKEASYSLDYILDKVLGREDPDVRKLKFDEASHVYGGEWHRFMQERYPAEYAVYNMFDCLSMGLLDRKTTDLRQMVSILNGVSEFHRFGSQPRRTCDDLHFFCQQHNRVIASTSDQMEDENDKWVVPLEGWIVTLPSYLVSDDGLKIIEELPDISTYIYGHVADLDVEGTYPNGECVANISKETTSRELALIKDVDHQTQRAIGVNLTGGHVNAVEICCNVLKAPTLDLLLSAFEETLPQTKTKPDVIDAVEREVESGEHTGYVIRGEQTVSDIEPFDLVKRDFSTDALEPEQEFI